jgi:hypothetical protein
MTDLERNLDDLKAYTAEDIEDILARHKTEYGITSDEAEALFYAGHVDEVRATAYDPSGCKLCVVDLIRVEGALRLNISVDYRAFLLSRSYTLLETVFGDVEVTPLTEDEKVDLEIRETLCVDRLPE